MRRLPQIVSFLLFIALCASVAYWAMQLFKPPVRPVAAPPRAAQAEIRPDAAAGLFGKSTRNAEMASNYQLRGVIFSGSPRNSVAIISADGKPAQAIGVDEEIVPGVTIKEVHRDHVLLLEGGANKRVDLPENAKGLEGIAATPAATPARPATPPVSNQPVPSRAQAAQAAQAAQPAPTVPTVPQVPQAPQAVTPQTAPSPQQPVQTPVQPPAVPPQVPSTITTAPPTTVVSPAPAPQAAPVQQQIPQPTAPSQQSLPGVPPGPMR
ncbi:type II secretion system protein N [Noviherbaspirillum sp. ST9]|uniref:type II secretion system protein N n=1 Tax=Noviherbaspirillum sp. ST9 TaxID=3401606 RepID=UPI003B587616